MRRRVETLYGTSSDVLQSAYLVPSLHVAWASDRHLNIHRRRAGPPVPQPGADARRSHVFSGGGHTLGSDEVDSEFIPDPDAVNARMYYSDLRVLRASLTMTL